MQAPWMPEEFQSVILLKWSILSSSPKFLIWNLHEWLKELATLRRQGPKIKILQVHKLRFTSPGYLQLLSAVRGENCLCSLSYFLSKVRMFWWKVLMVSSPTEYLFRPSSAGHFYEQIMGTNILQLIVQLSFCCLKQPDVPYDLVKFQQVECIWSIATYARHYLD